MLTQTGRMASCSWNLWTALTQVGTRVQSTLEREQQKESEVQCTQAYQQHWGWPHCMLAEVPPRIHSPAVPEEKTESILHQWRQEHSWRWEQEMPQLPPGEEEPHSPRRELNSQEHCWGNCYWGREQKRNCQWGKRQHYCYHWEQRRMQFPQGVETACSCLQGWLEGHRSLSKACC